MTIRATCKKCRTTYRVKDEHAGKRAKLPCGHVLTLPIPAASQAALVSEQDQPRATGIPLSSARSQRDIGLGKEIRHSKSGTSTVWKRYVPWLCGTVGLMVFFGVAAVFLCWKFVLRGAWDARTIPIVETMKPAPPEPQGMRPAGYFVARSIQGGLGTSGGGISPKDEKKTFLVVVISVPSQYFVPTEAELRAMKKDPGRECCLCFEARRFLAILADGRGYRGELISDWPENNAQLLGFCPGGFHRVRGKPLEPGERQSVAVAWALPPADCQLPLKVQIDNDEPIAVPENELQPPPIRRLGFP